MISLWDTLNETFYYKNYRSSDVYDKNVAFYNLKAINQGKLDLAV